VKHQSVKKAGCKVEKEKANVACGFVFLVTGGQYFDFAKRDLLSFFDVHM
jgi:hypothetical protein